jgi:hypothetical protein
MKKIVIKKLKNTEFIVYYRHNNVNVSANIAKDNNGVNQIVNEYLNTYFDGEEYNINDVVENETTNSHPLILVFYLDRELMSNKEIISPFVESVNRMLHEKQANVLAFFLPTDGEERIDCINPVITSESDMSRINTIIDDIKTSFSISSETNSEKDN